MQQIGTIALATTTDAPKGGLTIVLTGGGSGGHIIPVLAVAHALKRRQPACRLVYVAQKGDKLGDLVSPGSDIDDVKLISGGKWRRYHGEGWRQLFDVPTLAKNVRDVFRVIFGTWQSWRLLGKLKPEGVFIKGAYVGVPVGWAARRRHIPYVTLDLDAVPSLANRLIAKHATAHAVAMPKEIYPYPPDKTFYVGVPITETFQLVTPAQQAAWRAELKLDSYEQVLVAVGGGLGAVRLNQLLAAQAAALFEQYPNAVLIHVVGRDHEAEMNQKYDESLDTRLRSHVLVKGFVEDLYRYGGAADLIISRAGATSLAEMAAQGKACIIVPNPVLTGGHQLKNAEQLAAHGAIRVIDERSDEAGRELLTEICELLAAPTTRAQMGALLHSLVQPGAADRLAQLLLKTFDRDPHETAT